MSMLRWWLQITMLFSALSISCATEISATDDSSSALDDEYPPCNQNIPYSQYRHVLELIRELYAFSPSIVWIPKRGTKSTDPLPPEPRGLCVGATAARVLNKFSGKPDFVTSVHVDHCWEANTCGAIHNLLQIRKNKVKEEVPEPLSPDSGLGMIGGLWDDCATNDDDRFGFGVYFGKPDFTKLIESLEDDIKRKPPATTE